MSEKDHVLTIEQAREALGPKGKDLPESHVILLRSFVELLTDAILDTEAKRG